MDERERQKIIGLIGLLGSASDAEVLASARAIGRVLAAAGLSFGDLKNSLATVSICEIVVEPIHTYSSLAEMLMSKLDEMSDREQGFVRQMWLRMNVDADFEMTEKQQNWFFILVDNYGD